MSSACRVTGEMSGTSGHGCHRVAHRATLGQLPHERPVTRAPWPVVAQAGRRRGHAEAVSGPAAGPGGSVAQGASGSPTAVRGGSRRRNRRENRGEASGRQAGEPRGSQRQGRRQSEGGSQRQGRRQSEGGSRRRNRRARPRGGEREGRRENLGEASGKAGGEADGGTDGHDQGEASGTDGGSRRRGSGRTEGRLATGAGRQDGGEARGTQARGLIWAGTTRTGRCADPAARRGQTGPGAGRGLTRCDEIADYGHFRHSLPAAWRPGRCRDSYPLIRLVEV